MQVALLTIYDMRKAVDGGMSIRPGSSPFLEVWLMETKPCKRLYEDASVGAAAPQPGV